jgi:hypothetical protein
MTCRHCSRQATHTIQAHGVTVRTCSTHAHRVAQTLKGESK